MKRADVKKWLMISKAFDSIDTITGKVECLPIGWKYTQIGPKKFLMEIGNQFYTSIHN